MIHMGIICNSVEIFHPVSVPDYEHFNSMSRVRAILKAFNWIRGTEIGLRRPSKNGGNQIVKDCTRSISGALGISHPIDELIGANGPWPRLQSRQECEDK